MAARTNTLFLEFLLNPSISVNNWLRVFSDSDSPPFPPAPLALANASISSINTIAVCFSELAATFLAVSNNSLIRWAPVPTYFSTNSLPEADIKGIPVSPAIALAKRVFPLPGGPYNNFPLGTSLPLSTNFLGSFK